MKMRKICCEEMVRRNTPGIAIGGLSGGEDKESYSAVYVWKTEPFKNGTFLIKLCKFSVDACINWLPAEKPRYVMGVGYPEDLVVSVALGADMFDCVWPTRTAVR